MLMLYKYLSFVIVCGNSLTACVSRSIRPTANFVASSFSWPHYARLAVLNVVKVNLDMREDKEEFIQVCVKDIWRSPSKGVTFKVVSTNVTKETLKIFFFNNRIESLLLQQNVSSYNCDRAVNRSDISSAFSVWISLMMTVSGWNTVQ